MLGLRFLAFLALLATLAAPAAYAQQPQGYSNLPPARAVEERPPSAQQVQRDAFMTAVAKNDAGRVAELIRGGMAVDFNFDVELRGRSSESPLTMAARRGHLDIVRMLIEAGADARRKDGFGNNAIGAAQAPEMVRLLVQRGADPNAPGAYDQTAVAKAAEAGNLPLLEALLASGARFDASSRPPDLFTRVVEARKPELIAALLQRGADPRSPPTRALWPLVDKGDVANAKLLIQNGADPNAFDGRERIVLRALFRKQWEIAEALLDAGASLKIPDSPGCEKGVACESIQAARDATFNPPFLVKLKARGLDLDTVSSSRHTALTSLIVERPMAIQAVRGGTMIGVGVGPGGQQSVTRVENPVPTEVIPAPDNAARMKALLDAGADPNRKFQQFTPLMLVVGSPGKPPAMIDALIAAGGRVEFDKTIPPLNSVDDPGQFMAVPAASGMLVGTADTHQALATLNREGMLSGMRVGPLGWAVLYGRPEIAQRLLERDRRIEPADRNLVYFIAAAGNWDLALAALRYTRDVNVSDRAEFTPLMLAAAAGRADVVRALLAAGANVNARSVNMWAPRAAGGATALGAAKAHGHAEVVDILSQAGGRE